jgi:hypothetical protein
VFGPHVPLYFNRYLTHGDLPREVERIRDDERFCGFIFYETYSFLDYHPDGKVSMKPDFNVGEAMAAAG